MEEMSPMFDTSENSLENGETMEKLIPKKTGTTREEEAKETITREKANQFDQKIYRN